MSHGAVVSPVVKPISVSLTSGDGEVRVPSLNRRPGGGFAPWAVEGLVGDLVPKRGSVVWGRVGVSLADVSSVLHSSSQAGCCNDLIHRSRWVGEGIVCII